MMSSHRRMCATGVFVFAVVVILSVANVVEAQTEAQKKAAQQQAQAQKAAQDALRKQELAGLRSAYTLLALANNNYQGHKAAAMREVEAAIVLIQNTAMKPLNERINSLRRVNEIMNGQMTVIGIAPLPEEAQVISDTQVNNAGKLLVTLGQTMAANNQPKLNEHVQKAIKEIQAVKREPLAPIKGREIDALTGAYVLLATANHDYDGHRIKAMDKLGGVLNQIDAQLLAKGNVKQRIQAMRDANTQLLARIQNNQEPTISEPQALSDWQLMFAGTLIQRTAPYYRSAKQKAVYTQLGESYQEIGIALTIR